MTQRRPWWLCNRALHTTDEPNRRVRRLRGPVGDLAFWRTPDLSRIEKFPRRASRQLLLPRRTRRARAFSPLNSGYHLSLRLRAAMIAAPLTLTHLGLALPFSREGANQCGVHCDLGTPEEGKAIDYNLQSSSVKRCEYTDVHVPGQGRWFAVDLHLQGRCGLSHVPDTWYQTLES